LVFCLEEEEELYQLCSADEIVFRVLAQLDRSNQAVSLEEVLADAGLSRPLDWQYTKKFRQEKAAKGVEDRLSGLGLKG
jgi:hypothetical protein